MPALNKFFNKKRAHQIRKNKNFAANLIRNEFIVTTSANAKRAQPKIEQFLAKTIHFERTNEASKDLPFEERIKANKNLSKNIFDADKPEVAQAIFDKLTKRYSKRTHGFTRLIKLEPRLGEDKAPMSVLELVDSDLEVKFWFNAKVVARLELQGLPLDEQTEHNVNKLVQFRENGQAKFRDAVEECKQQFFKYNPETKIIESEEIKENLKNVPTYNFQKGTLLASKKFKVKDRSSQKEFTLPKSPFLKQQAQL